jgi:hypothetical protein
MKMGIRLYENLQIPWKLYEDIGTPLIQRTPVESLPRCSKGQAKWLFGFPLEFTPMF